MKLLIGLGNPGEKYSNTRHNVGFALVDILASQFSDKFESKIAKKQDLIFAKPQTFMNESGRAVEKIVNYYNITINNIIVAHDDLDIALGAYKFVKAKGPKIHNGVNSVEDFLGSKDFWRVRIGVDSRTKEERIREQGRSYVLKKMTQNEIGILEKVYDSILVELNKHLGID